MQEKTHDLEAIAGAVGLAEITKTVKVKIGGSETVMMAEVDLHWKCGELNGRHCPR